MRVQKKQEWNKSERETMTIETKNSSLVVFFDWLEMLSLREVGPSFFSVKFNKYSQSFLLWNSTIRFVNEEDLDFLLFL